VFEMTRVSEKSPIYDPAWMLVRFTDTVGIYREDPPKKGLFFDHLFGDGPTRYGLKTVKDVILSRYEDVKNEELFGSGHKDHNKNYFVKRTGIMEKVKSLSDSSRYFPFRALSLQEFLGVIEKIPSDAGNFWHDRTKPMVGFLRGLTPEKHLVMAGQGRGFLSDYPELFGEIWYNAIIGLSPF